MRKDILVYGLGTRFNNYKDILTSDVCMRGKIIGYSDRIAKSNIDGYIFPENLKHTKFDIVVVTCADYEPSKEYLINHCNIEKPIISFFEYIYQEWHIDRRAVKVLDLDYISDLTRIKKICDIKSFMEIGANFAQDATLVKYFFDIPDERIIVFEPHPCLYKEIVRRYNYKAYNCAVSDSNGKTSFIACDIEKERNNGMSSIKNSQELFSGKEYYRLEIEQFRMDKIWDDSHISEIDLCKVDVEGNTWEVLQGFGNRIKNVKCFHIEADYYAFWENEILAEKIFTYLKKSGFEMVKLTTTIDLRETDSLWVRKDIMDFKMKRCI